MSSKKVSQSVKDFNKKVKKKNKSGQYEMWITYNSNKKRLRIPVLPEEIQISYPDKNDTVYVYGVGEVTIKKHPGAFVMKFSSFFPKEACQGSVKSPKSPKACKEFMEKVMKLETPAKFIFTGSPCRVNTLCTIKFDINEKAGDTGTIYYDITITEYKKPSVRKIKVKKKNGKKKGKAGKKSKRASTKSKSSRYVVKEHDYLQKISKKFYGTSTQWRKIYNANKKVIGNNPNLIYAGQVLTIPK